MGDEAEGISRRPPPPPPRTAPPPPPPGPIGGGDDAHWGNCSPAFRAKAEALLWTLRDGYGWVVLTAEIVEAYPASPLAALHCRACPPDAELSTASVHLTQAAELAPRCPQIALALAEVLLAMGEDTMAMDVCDRGLSVTDNTDPASTCRLWESRESSHPPLRMIGSRCAGLSSVGFELEPWRSPLLLRMHHLPRILSLRNPRLLTVVLILRLLLILKVHGITFQMISILPY